MPPELDPSSIQFDETFQKFLEEYDKEDETVLALQDEEYVNPIVSLYQNDNYLKLKKNFEEQMIEAAK